VPRPSLDWAIPRRTAVDAVAVRERVVQALEHDHAKAFAEQGAVAAGLEGRPCRGR
jgi:hypothetical protein